VASFGVFFLSSQLCVSFKLQGLGLVWVQLPKEVFTKKHSQNHHFCLRSKPINE
jgi:hypothetical protein